LAGKVLQVFKILVIIFHDLYRFPSRPLKTTIWSSIMTAKMAVAANVYVNSGLKAITSDT